jgi:hypothetical protein
MANFTQKPEWRLPEDLVYYLDTAGETRNRICFADIAFNHSTKYLLKVNLPVNEEEQVIETYINYLTSIGLFELVDSYGFETRGGKQYVWFVSKPNTPYRQLVMVGTLLRGIGCFPYVAINFHEMLSYELDIDPTKLFLLSWGKVFVDGINCGFDLSYGPYNVWGHGLGAYDRQYGDIAKQPIDVDLKRISDQLYQNFIKRFDVNTVLTPYLKLPIFKPLTKQFVKEFFNV